MEQLHINKSDLLTPPEQKNAAYGSADFWDWAKDHQVAIGIGALSLVALAAGGAYLARRASAQAEKHLEGKLSSAIESAALKTSSNTLDIGTNLLEQTAVKAAKSQLGAKMEPVVSSVVQTAKVGVTESIALKNVPHGLPPAYSWSPTKSPNDTRAMLDAILAGKSREVFKTPASDVMLSVAERSGKATTVGELAGVKAAGTIEGQVATAIPTPSPDKVHRFVIKANNDGGASHAAPIIDDNLAELLGVHPPHGTFGILDDTVLVARRMDPANLFRRLIPILEADMPGLSVRPRKL